MIYLCQDHVAAAAIYIVRITWTGYIFCQPQSSYQCTASVLRPGSHAVQCRFRASSHASGLTVTAYVFGLTSV
jgi:hypothetical protein